MQVSFDLSVNILPRSGRSDAHQPLNATVEDFNVNIKAWVFGEHNSGMWQSICRNYTKPVELRKKVNLDSVTIT